MTTHKNWTSHMECYCQCHCDVDKLWKVCGMGCTCRGCGST